MDVTPSLVAFGALASWPGSQWQDHVKTILKENRTLKPVVAAVLELPSLWDALTVQDSGLDSSLGRAAAHQLAEWMIEDTCEHVLHEKHNALMMPITVISHIIQYLHFLENSSGAVDHSSVIENVTTGGGVQGFCAGLLSALAVASAQAESEIGLFAANSIRLAFCIGVYIDLDEAGPSNFATLAVRWSSTISRSAVETLLATHPETYIAVLRDDREATITCPVSVAKALREDLTQAGISVRDTGLSGRYHSTAHRRVPERILQACEGCLQPSFSNVHLVRSNTDGTKFSAESATITALHSILEEQANWYCTISAAANALSSGDDESYILAIGSDAVPQSLAKQFHMRKMSVNSVDVREIVSPRASRSAAPSVFTNHDDYPGTAIAVIGMACKFPGANTVDEFWNSLTEGRSMLSKMPADRFTASHSSRSNDDMKFWGNFVDDIDAWDHKFFKKSAREAASTDPQQRHLLQVTYQALQDAGYFCDQSCPRDIGAYIGACSTDYDFNVASHPPSAYSTIGTLRAFLSGKLSHYFGWSGPSLTFDTACSSSAVAIHTACRALQSRECSQAVAGGATLFSSPYLYENLAAAHFLSPSGATKPFDASADGYCRGEGVGVVVLKRLSDAIADGDAIRAVIAGSAINQNSNCVPITVPHSASQAALYRKAAKEAGLDTHVIDFIEAHGTGTPVGDPIEMESIREAFGGAKQRTTPLYVSSVKGAIGHLEGASGIAALTKAILQLEYKTIVPQASFAQLNPRIPALEPDHIHIPTSLQRLQVPRLTGCVNNYGAAGSNATLMLMEAPPRQTGHRSRAASCKYPFGISAASVGSLVAYCRTLDTFISSWLATHESTEHVNLVPSLAYSLWRQQDPSHSHLLAFTSPSTDVGHLQTQLRKQTVTQNNVAERPKAPPLVLCSGGQGADMIGLDRSVWEKSPDLRCHLDQCHEILCKMGYPGIYPYVFRMEPVTDVVAHNSMLFAMQYACAQSWIDAGLQVDSLIGHSLGQITALSVSGILSLQDGLKFVAGRAALMVKYWGPEPGTMVVLDADEQQTNEITSSIQERDPAHQYEIACYNGPKCHVVVSDQASAEVLIHDISQRGMRYKRLHLQYGFHSRFTEDLYPQLELLAASLEIHEPKIALETCTADRTWTKPTAKLIAAHTRDPVFFTHAVQRVRDRLGACTWLEAGSNSTVIGLAARIVGTSAEVPNKFLLVALNKPDALDKLADVAVELWKRGYNLQHWTFHRSQQAEYDLLRLPPYEFERHRHWLRLVAHQSVSSACQPRDKVLPRALPDVLISLSKSDWQGHHFVVNPESQEYQVLAEGHKVLGVCSCPPSVYVDLAARAAYVARRSNVQYVLPEITGLQVGVAMGTSVESSIELLLEAYGPNWRFTVASRLYDGTKIYHASGIVSMQARSPELEADFARFERLANRRYISAVLSEPEDSVQGSMVYKVLSSVVEYGECYRGVRSLCTRSGQIAARIVLPEALKSCLHDDSIINSAFLNYFTQVAGIHANFMCDHPDGQIFRLASIDVLRTSSAYQPLRGDSFSHAVYEVLAYTTHDAGKVANDIFVYDAATGKMVFHILGAVFKAVDLPITTTQQFMETSQAEKSTTSPHRVEVPTTTIFHDQIRTPHAVPSVKPTVRTRSAKTVIHARLCQIFEDVAEIEPAAITGHATFESLGIDSLMIMEIVSELSRAFSVELPLDDLMELTDVDALLDYLESRGCGLANDEELESDCESKSTSSSSSTSLPTSCASARTPSTPSSEISWQSEDFPRRLSKLICEHLELDMELTGPENLADLGLDSLVAIEIASDVKRQFSLNVDMEELDESSTFADFLRLVTGNKFPLGPISTMTAQKCKHRERMAVATAAAASPEPCASREPDDSPMSRAFQNIRLSFDDYANETGFSGFWTDVYPQQSQLVLAYVIEAFQQLGCNLQSLSTGEKLPTMHVEAKHKHLMARMRTILSDAGILEPRKNSHYRTQRPVSQESAAELHARMLNHHPKHASETKLLNVTASCLASCLTGRADPLRLLFADPTNKDILADVYDKAPMCQATTRLLAQYLFNTFSTTSSLTMPNEPFRILEVGAGTGGTACYLVHFLQSLGLHFEYHFTDISGALVSAARRKFRNFSSTSSSSSSENVIMKFSTFDCNVPCPAELRGKFHAVIATNCIHATPHASRSAKNVKELLREDGVFCLVEFTRSLYWFDLVYGLLEGWWVFDDGRMHALADEGFWDQSLREAGFGDVNWTDGDTLESQTMRLICAFP